MMPSSRAQSCAQSCDVSRALRGALGRAICAVVMAGALVAGCDEAPPPKAPAATPASPGPAKAKLAELPPQMVAAVSAGKTSEMISVHFALQAVPAVGRPLPVEIAIVPHRPFTAIRALFQGPESLGMSTGKQFAHEDDVGSEVVLKHQLTLQPSEEGVFLVTAAVDTEGDGDAEGGQVTRVYSIPVIVHPAATPAKPSGNPSPATPTG